MIGQKTYRSYGSRLCNDALNEQGNVVINAKFFKVDVLFTFFFIFSYFCDEESVLMVLGPIALRVGVVGVGIADPLVVDELVFGVVDELVWCGLCG